MRFIDQRQNRIRNVIVEKPRNQCTKINLYIFTLRAKTTTVILHYRHYKQMLYLHDDK